MNALLPNENQLIADIDRLREQFPQTQDLYQEVCVLLFFRYGITPTANKLYQLVRKGSMSAPAEALNRFWKNLREKSRVTIEHPDLPNALKAAAGELVATLWQSAQAAANEQYSSFQHEAESKIGLAEDAAVIASSNYDQALAELSAAQNQLRQAYEQVELLRHEVTSLTSTNSSIDSQLQSVRADLLSGQTRLDACRTDFAAELEKIRQTAKQSEERLVGTEARALVEIDRERVNAAQARKALETALSEKSVADGRYRNEVLALQKQLANQSHNNGIKEGELRAMAVNQEKANDELDRLRTQLTDARSEISMLQAKNISREAAKAGPKKSTKKPIKTQAKRSGGPRDGH